MAARELLQAEEDLIAESLATEGLKWFYNIK
jgi:hypothetical protein